MVGSCRYSDITIFSFHPLKIITSGEGGMALTNSEELHRTMELYRSHGITRNPDQMLKEWEGGWYYEQIELGYNYRLTDIHAALGLSQLKQLDNFVQKRRKIASYYAKNLNHAGIQLPDIKKQSISSWHLFVIRFKNSRIRKAIYDALHVKGIGVQVHYIPIYRQPFYQQFGFQYSNFPNCEQYYQTCLSLPIYPELSQEQQQYIIDSILLYLNNN